MRVLEHGLRDMARRLRLTSAKGRPLSRQDWGKIIDRAEDKIAQLRTAALGTKGSPTPTARTVARRLARVDYYSRAAQQFAYFKDAWRNHTMHSRTFYDEAEATKVYEAVKHFMQQLAKRP
jgi:hypothetical protein